MPKNSTNKESIFSKIKKATKKAKIIIIKLRISLPIINAVCPKKNPNVNMNMVHTIKDADSALKKILDSIFLYPEYIKENQCMPKIRNLAKKIDLNGFFKKLGKNKFILDSIVSILLFLENFFCKKYPK